jgi:hypothetical protein
VNHALWEAVGLRDGGCVGHRYLGAPGVCRNAWGRVIPERAYELMERDHIRDEPPIGTLAKTHAGGFGKRPPDDLGHLVTLCYALHHGGWATSHRPELRDYLSRLGGS